MKRWRHIVVFDDLAVIWRGLAVKGKKYPLTDERRRRLEAVLGGQIEYGDDGDSWLWRWDDWDWTQIAGGR